MTQKPRRPSDGQAGKLRCPPLDPETIEQRVVARLARQDIFDRRPVPLLSFVMEESVLRRRYGGKDVLRGQLEQLLLIGQKKNVAIRVMPLDNEESAGVDGPFTIVTRGNGKRFMYAEAQLQRCRGRSVCRGRGQYARCARPGLQGRRRAHPHRVVGGVGRVRRTGLVGAGSLTLAGNRPTHKPCSSIRRIRFRLRRWDVRKAVTYAVNSSGVPRWRWQSRMLSSRPTSCS